VPPVTFGNLACPDALSTLVRSFVSHQTPHLPRFSCPPYPPYPAKPYSLRIKSVFFHSTNDHLLELDPHYPHPIDFPTLSLKPAPMARFAQSTSVDSWGAFYGRREEHNDTRVTLPPINDATSRRGSASFDTQNNAGSYAFFNTFESTRPTLCSSTSSDMELTRPPMRSTQAVPQQRNTRTGSLPDGFQEGNSQRTSLSGSGSVSLGLPWLNHTTFHNHQQHRADPQHMHSSSSGTPSPPNLSRSFSSFPDFDGSTFHASQSTGAGSHSPSFTFASGPFPNNSAYVHPRSHQAPLTLAQADAMVTSVPSPAPTHSSLSMNLDTNMPSSREQLEDELNTLRTKVRELEFINDLVLVELEHEKAKRGSPSSLSQNGLPTPPYSTSSSPSNQSQTFQASWRLRTDARIKKFCSLNRAGNALCAWHDSRRERRAYPPRMAPPGHLNCGCTYNEALFEESLARNGVGSYHPGETVRMDPALRNPLLKLLEWRFGYKDGDFERDPGTGYWIEGEGDALWEAKAAAGPHVSRRQNSRSEEPAE
jgi:hypothetical protein